MIAISDYLLAYQILFIETRGRTSVLLLLSVTVTVKMLLGIHLQFNETKH